MTKDIRLIEVCRHFKLGSADVKALDKINLEIGQGEFVALVGPSGSGKSTLLNLLGGLDRPTSGKLNIKGLGLQDATETELTIHRRHNVGFIFQSFNLLPTMSALENVALPLMLSGVPLKERLATAADLLKRVGLEHRLDHRPTEMSGGEQQRAAIARALVNNPQLILADEPTGNLDSGTGNEVMQLLRNLNVESGVTLIVVTHDPEIAAYADRVIYLRDGGIEKIEGTKNTPSHKVVPDTQLELTFNGGLSLRDLARTALDNLRRRPVRNILTASLGLENVFISPTFPEEEDAFDPFGIAVPEKPLTPEIVAAFRAISEVQSVTPTLDLPDNIEISLSYADIVLPVRLSGGFAHSPPGQRMPVPPGVLEGGALGEGDTQGLTLIEGLADQLLVNTDLVYDDLVNKTVTLTIRLPRGETKEFMSQIVEIESGRGSNSIELGLAERTEIKAWWYGRPDTLQTDGYDMLIVRAVDQMAVPAVVDAADTMELEAQSLGTILELANRVLAILQALLGSVGGLALLVATLGVANTMMMAIYERTREIGVLKALGATSREVRRMFTADAMLLGIIGGIVGVILGTLLGRLVDWIGHLYLESEGIIGIGQMSIVPPWLAIGALVFAGFIGVLGGLYPAARAAQLDPVAALKHE